MDHQQWSFRVGASVITCALLMRLASGGFFTPLAEFLTQPRVLSFLTYLETGRIVRFSPSTPPVEVFSVEIPETQPPATQPPILPDFTPADGQAVEFKYGCTHRPDAGALITRPLTWELTGDTPRVLIIHTHATEGYTQTPDTLYSESAAFRTLDEAYNMISIGDRVAALLEAGGISVIHDRQLHDYPSYNGSYNSSRRTVAQYLEEYPNIALVLDLHRDASADLTHQIKPAVTVNGQSIAQLMLVIGTDASGLPHPQWEENLALGLKLQTQLERLAPGICRPINLRAQRFNQDQSTGALLIEVGAAGNTHPEALLAADLLAQAILSLAHGAVTVDSTN